MATKPTKSRRRTGSHRRAKAPTRKRARRAEPPPDKMPFMLMAPGEPTKVIRDEHEVIHEFGEGVGDLMVDLMRMKAKHALEERALDRLDQALGAWRTRERIDLDALTFGPYMPSRNQLAGMLDELRATSARGGWTILVFPPGLLSAVPRLAHFPPAECAFDDVLEFCRRITAAGEAGDTLDAAELARMRRHWEQYRDLASAAVTGDLVAALVHAGRAASDHPEHVTADDREYIRVVARSLTDRRCAGRGAGAVVDIDGRDQLPTDRNCSLQIVNVRAMWKLSEAQLRRARNCALL